MRPAPRIRLRGDNVPILQFPIMRAELSMPRPPARPSAVDLPRIPVVGIDIPYTDTLWGSWVCFDPKAKGKPRGFFDRAWLLTQHTLNGVGVKVSLNGGVSAPLGIPPGVRLESFSPAFAPCLSLDRDFVLTSWLLLNVGVQFEYKGMSTRARVHDFYTEVEQRDTVSGTSFVASGWFTGYNNLKFLAAYVSVPLRLGFVLPNRRTVIRVGGYASYAFTRVFQGSVEGGYLWSKPAEEGGNSERLPVEHESFDFSEHLTHWDAGVELSMRQRLSQRFFMDAGFTLGFMPILRSSFQGVPYRMQNLYLSLGVGYKFRS